MKMTPKQQAARQHNGLMGHCAMIYRNSLSIAGSYTTTTKAKNLAMKIASLSKELDIELRTNRIDPP